ncbi:unnamed protein product [Porites evermanni]|uniref:CTHRC1 C-terminal domain-containing protein n=1 Tax=Porites evermanni TaxID=104178 RepID=A0ABN8REX4_9CNID|nr:unnamed protein product [Porites evermanni]
MIYVLILSFITLCSTTANNDSSKSRDKVISSFYNSSSWRKRYLIYEICLPFCFGGHPGTNGLPGMHGMPGSAGAPGRDGRDGVKGDQGNSGKTGPQGPPGANGMKGVKGEPGIQGPAGQKGDQGDKGDNGSARLASYMNWKECVWKRRDDKDSGEIYVSQVILALLSMFTLLVTLKRHRVAAAVVGCISPSMAMSVALLELLTQTATNHRHRHIEGHCHNIKKGTVRVGLSVGKCVTGHKLADSLTGWHSMSRIFIEEVPKPQQ